MYKIGSTIGMGAFASVMIGMNRETKERVAIKKIKVSKDDKLQRLEALREAKIMMNLQHRNIVRFVDSFQTKNSVYIV